MKTRVKRGLFSGQDMVGRRRVGKFYKGTIDFRIFVVYNHFKQGPMQCMKLWPLNKFIK